MVWKVSKRYLRKEPSENTAKVVMQLKSQPLLITWEVEILLSISDYLGNSRKFFTWNLESSK